MYLILLIITIIVIIIIFNVDFNSTYRLIWARTCIMHLLLWSFFYDFVNTKESIPIQFNPMQFQTPFKLHFRNFTLQIDNRNESVLYTFTYIFFICCPSWLVILLIKFDLTFSRRRPLSYRNQSIDLQSKSMDWFLYDNGLRHERVD